MDTGNYLCNVSVVWLYSPCHWWKQIYMFFTPLITSCICVPFSNAKIHIHIYDYMFVNSHKSKHMHLPHEYNNRYLRSNYKCCASQLHHLPSHMQTVLLGFVLFWFYCQSLVNSSDLSIQIRIQVVIVNKIGIGKIAAKQRTCIFYRTFDTSLFQFSSMTL